MDARGERIAGAFIKALHCSIRRTALFTLTLVMILEVVVRHFGRAHGVFQLVFAVGFLLPSLIFMYLPFWRLLKHLRKYNLVAPTPTTLEVLTDVVIGVGLMAVASFAGYLLLHGNDLLP